MTQYQNKSELIAKINETYDLFIKEFEEVDNKDIHKRVAGVDKTPSEMLAYQIGWLEHIMQWEKDELSGKTVITPAPDIKWNEISKLYQMFYDQYSSDNLPALLKKFAQSKKEFIVWIDSLDEKTLFELDQRKWAYIKAGWPVWKWLHINSVAPFSSFRSKIRKWKKESH
ncbi:ClbS/DfsB family four-helix bundle protein [Microgenomates group bacterium]|nr:ClbS/DfsB family four-helix bundle protein [Microgenomates group bacterium]